MLQIHSGQRLVRLHEVSRNMPDMRDLDKHVVRGIILDESGRAMVLKQVLRVGELKSFYELPGGKVDPVRINGELAVERPFDALRREILEEVNLEIESVVSYLGSVDYTSDLGLAARQSFFHVTVKSPNAGISLSSEHEGSPLWISKNGFGLVGRAIREKSRLALEEFWKMNLSANGT